MRTRTEEEIIAALNGLIETCTDGERGFRSAAERVASAGLRELLSSYARQRLQFAEALSEEVRRLGGERETSVAATGELHRGWVDVKSALQRNEEGAVIAEVERGEDEAVRRYRAALEGVSDPDLRALIERQYARIRETHDRVRALEKAAV